MASEALDLTNLDFLEDNGFFLLHLLLDIMFCISFFFHHQCFLLAFWIVSKSNQWNIFIVLTCTWVNSVLFISWNSESLKVYFPIKFLLFVSWRISESKLFFPNGENEFNEFNKTVAIWSFLINVCPSYFVLYFLSNYVP